ncbi:hypothetical protein JJB09_02510 [Rhizobium sp. KVB221]|uniref:Uncharacterized protein n=1 Tax=Rhizobium setariae TaxID=2801340 RepID=A0A936YQD7_9HYPH|nr:hypothetical protein [Rhizobium setariae]MBL0370891.1 hypothetical protein [Rhizobium setariae]
MPRIIQLHPSAPTRKHLAPAETRHSRNDQREAIGVENNAVAIAMAIAGGARTEEGEPILAIEKIVAIILRSCKRLGRRPSRIPALISADLDRHCKQGDPTARMLRDWIDCKSGFEVAVPETDRRAISAFADGEG